MTASPVTNLRLAAGHESWPLDKPFTISRGTKTHADVVVVTLSKDGVTGHGECVPYPRYDESVPQVLEALAAAKDRIERALSFEAIAAMDLPHAARNALDCALWDWQAKRANSAGLAARRPSGTRAPHNRLHHQPRRACRDGEGSAEAARPLLKLKLGKPGDAERLHAIRDAVPDTRLIIDANEGWSADICPPCCAPAAIRAWELVEQPLPAGADEALQGMSRDCLICADESAHGLGSLPDLAGKYDAINIKLDKTAASHRPSPLPAPRKPGVS